MPSAGTGMDSQIRQCLFCRYCRTDRNWLQKNIARHHYDPKQHITVNHRHGTKSQRTSRTARPHTRPCQMLFIVLWFLCWKIHFYNRFYDVQQRYIVWKTSRLTGTLASKVWILSVIKKQFCKNLHFQMGFYRNAVSQGSVIIISWAFTVNIFISLFNWLTKAVPFVIFAIWNLHRWQKCWINNLV